MKKSLLFIPLIVLTIGCSNNKQSSNESKDYFKEYYEQVTDPAHDEFSFIQFFDAKANRFNVQFIYEPHFHFGLKITEYAATSYYWYPSEGEFSSDYESMTCTLVGSSSELFKEGEYILSHKLNNGKDSFSLKAANKTYQLTTEYKESPINFNPGLLGTFAYMVDDEPVFSMEVEADAVDNNYVLSIGLEEGDLVFEAINIEPRGNVVEFTLSGTENGTYLSNQLNCIFDYIDENVEEEMWILTSGQTNYVMTYIEEGHEEEKKEGYFYNNYVSVSNNDFSLQMMNFMGTDVVSVIINELQEGGKKDIQTFFSIGDNGDSLTNLQGIAGNLVFTTGNTYKFVHSVANGNDKIDLYKNGSLLYSNLEIEILLV